MFLVLGVFSISSLHQQDHRLGDGFNVLDNSIIFIIYLTQLIFCKSLSRGRRGRILSALLLLMIPVMNQRLG